MTGARIFGIIVSAVGVVATLMPDWFAAVTGPASADVFESVERHVRGGMVLGVGLAFIAVTALRPWSRSVPLASFWLVAGALGARFIGVIIHGAVAKQWMLVALEVVIMAACALWLRRKGTAAS